MRRSLNQRWAFFVSKLLFVPKICMFMAVPPTNIALIIAHYSFLDNFQIWAIASSDLKKLLQNKNLFLTLGLRLLVVPAAALAVFALLGVSGMVPMVVLILEACPCVTITTVFSIRFHHDEELAAGAVVFSTLCSIITLPLYALALTAVL